jgi:hypothetical protein
LWNCAQVDTNKCKLLIGKRSQETEVSGRSVLKRRRSARREGEEEEEEAGGGEEEGEE